MTRMELYTICQPFLLLLSQREKESEEAREGMRKGRRGGGGGIVSERAKSTAVLSHDRRKTAGGN